jgi:hypothetical protein
MKKLVFEVNGEKVDSFKSKGDLVVFIENKFGVERFDVNDEDDNEFDLSVEECVDMLLEKGKLICWNEELCRRGNDYCNLVLKVK